MRINYIESLSNNGRIIEVESGKSIKETFAYLNYNNVIILVNGHIADNTYILNDNDAVTIRLLPGDVHDQDNWWIYTFIVPFGFIIQPAVLAYDARVAAEKANEELEKIKKLTNNNELDNRPFLRGASNSIATNKSQPYFCGRNFLTPYLFSKPYYRIYGKDGVEQEIYTILEGGFKDIVIDKLGIGETTIKQWNETTPQNGTYSINEGIFADGQVEIRQDGELFEALPELNAKVISNVINKAIARDSKVSAGEDEHLIFDLDPHAKTVELAIKFPYGLYAFNSNNNRIETQVTITPEYSLDGGNTYIEFTFDGGSNVFKKNLAKEIRYTARHTFTIEDYQTLQANNQQYIICRVRSNGNTDQKIKNDCYLYYYQSIIFDPAKSSAPAGQLNDNGVAGLVDCLNVENKERAYSCIIGLKLKATKNNESKLSQINIIATSTGRTWNGEKWSSTKAPTRNPAAIALEVLTTEVHPASRYNDKEIDLEAWGALYEYCESNDILFDYLITQNQTKKDTLQKICDACNATIYKDLYGRVSVAIDRKGNAILAVYNPQNIISISHKKTFAPQVDALRIKYISSENDLFKENTYLLPRTVNGEPVTLGANSIIKDISAVGITTFDNIVKYGRRLMAINELRQISTQLKIGFEGVYYTPCQRLLVQDPSLNADIQDAVINKAEYYAGKLNKIILSNPVQFNTNYEYGIIVNCTDANGAHPLPLKVKGAGITKELEVITEWSMAEQWQPQSNNVLSFGALDENGEFSSITKDYIISRISRTEEGFTLDLSEYNEAIYEPGEIPAYKPIISATPTPTVETIPVDAITSEQLENRIDGIINDNIQAAVDKITNGTTYSNIYNVTERNPTIEEIIARMDEESRRASASISMSEEEILLQVEDMDAQQRAFIDITRGEILSQVDNMAQELRGLIDVQAGAVTALVEGGGASGQLSLSLNLPVIIDATTRSKLIAASNESKVNAVYGSIENTENYGIKGNAGNTAVKALWDDAVAAGLIASQIELDADQIYINGEVIINDAKKIKAELIDVDNILARELTIKNAGSIQSENFNFDDEAITGFKLDGATGELRAVAAKLKTAELIDAVVKSTLTIEGDYLATPTINPYITMQKLRGGIRAMFTWDNGALQYKTDNIESVTKLDTGTYLVKFTDFTYMANCFGYSLYHAYFEAGKVWTVPTEAKPDGQVNKQSYKVGIVTDITTNLNAGYKIIQNYGTNEGSNHNDLQDFVYHALVYFML